LARKLFTPRALSRLRVRRSVSAVRAITGSPSRAAPKPLQHLQAVHVRHDHVGEDHVGRAVLGDPEALATVARGHDVVAERRHLVDEEPQQVRLVVHDEDEGQATPSEGVARGVYILAGVEVYFRPRGARAALGGRGSKMFTRIGRFFKAIFNAVLGEAEAQVPVSMLEQSVREMLDNLRVLREATATTIAFETKGKRELEAQNARVKNLDSQAEEALKQGNEKLARRALQLQVEAKATRDRPSRSTRRPSSAPTTPARS
jgi:hypothetical protein